jgi:ADP-heptose:LPS heptosyltransferase
LGVWQNINIMKIAIIEIQRYHDECLYSQIKIIKSHSNVHLSLICNESLKHRVKHFNQVDEKIFISVRKGFKQWVDIIRLWRHCKTENYDKIILNTAQERVISRLLRLPFKKRTKFYGILHQTKKLSNSYNQKYISKKIEHYFVLSQYLKDKIKSDISFSVLYPIYFPNYPYQKVTKKEDEIRICIPGQVNLRKRDYKILFESIQRALIPFSCKSNNFQLTFKSGKFR